MLICEKPVRRVAGVRLVSSGFLSALLLLAGAPLVQGANEHQSPESIKQAVRNFLSLRVEAVHEQTPRIEIGRLDPRLRLQRCDRPLETFLTGRERLVGGVAVGVRCGGPKPWTLYVSARVRVYGEVVVARSSLARGTVLERSDLRRVRKDLSTLNRTHFTDIEEALGKLARRSIQAGSIVSPDALAEPKLVRRGERVVLTAASGAVEVRMAGEALSDGSAGQRIRVRNLRSKRVVQGTVIRRGVVEVAL